MAALFKKILINLAFLMLILSTASLANETQSPSIPPRPTKAINAFIDHMVKKHHFNREKLQSIMDNMRYNPKVIRMITAPFEKKPWDFYRRYFVRPDRIANGVSYWNTHQKILAEIKAKYGVPPYVIVALIGIESFFGKHAGTYREIDALGTLAFYYPKRAKFFKKELEHFLVLTRHEGISPLSIKGSYAGALGIPQFMPSSYRHYGVKYGNDSFVDLFSNHGDAIASIANYLKKSGWVYGKPVAVPAKINGKIPKKLISNTAKPKYTLARFKQNKIVPTTKEAKNFKAALIVMQNTNSQEHWLVFRNFYAIMKYNPRTTYALAVYELSQAIKKAHEYHHIKPKA